MPERIPPPDPEHPPVGLTPGLLQGVAGVGPGSRLVAADLGANPNLTAPPAIPLPPPPPPRAKPQPVGGQVQESKLLRRIVPEYPHLARVNRVQGTVQLAIDVDEEGNVAEVRVLEGHPLLLEAAVQAVRQWKYSPTLLNGEPIPVVSTVSVIFQLK
jgi:protein TonB